MKEFFTNNRVKLGDQINNKEMVVLLSGTAPKSTADAYHEYWVNKNFFYFTGLERENFIFALVKNDDKVESHIFIEKANYDIEKWVGRKLLEDKAKEISGIDNVKFVDDFNAFINREIYNDKIETLYFDLEKLSWDEPHSIAHKYAKEIKERYLHITVKSIHPIVSDLRMIKEDFEVEQIKQAIDLTKQGFEAVMDKVKPGLYEYQVEAEFDYAIKYHGADRNSFHSIFASGEDAVILHYVENNKKIADGSLLLMDFGAQYKEYAADITRTIPANGKFTDRQKELYNIVLGAMDATIEIMKPGIPFSRLNEVCKEYITKECKRINLIKEDSEVGKYFYHGVSHFMGLDVHDLGSRDITLKPGMVFTCEPGLYVAEEGIGIRIEDDILITEDGNINLSSAIMKTVEDIESYMSK